MEITKLRQQQQNSRAQLITMEQRLQGMEGKQKQMMVFLSKALKNPAHLQQLSLRSEEKQQLLENAGKKRRLLLNPGYKNLQAGEELGVELEIENIISEMVDDEAGSTGSHLMQSSNGSVDGISKVMWEELMTECLISGTGSEKGDDWDIGDDVEELVGNAIGWDGCAKFGGSDGISRFTILDLMEL